MVWPTLGLRTDEEQNRTEHLQKLSAQDNFITANIHPMFGIKCDELLALDRVRSTVASQPCLRLTITQNIFSQLNLKVVIRNEVIIKNTERPGCAVEVNKFQKKFWFQLQFTNLITVNTTTRWCSG